MNDEESFYQIKMILWKNRIIALIIILLMTSVIFIIWNNFDNHPSKIVLCGSVLFFLLILLLEYVKIQNRAKKLLQGIQIQQTHKKSN